MIAMNSLTRLLTPVVFFATALTAGCMRVDIENPENGEFIDQPTVTVSGNLFSTTPEDFPLDVDDMVLEINGSPVAIAPDGSYSTEILLDPLQVFNAIEADILEVSKGFVDSDRVVVIVGDSILDGDYSPEAIALQINDSGLNSLEPVVAGLVDLDLPSLLPVNTVVANNICVIDGLFGCLGRATITVANPQPTISSFAVNFDSQQNSVNTNIVLNDFDLNVYIDGGAWILVPNCDLNLMASSVTLTGNFGLEPDGLTPTKVDVAQIGSISTSVANFDQTFTSGACDDFLIGDIIQLIVGDVEPLVIAGLEGFLNGADGNNNTPIAAAIESALAGVDISGPVGQALNAELDAPFFQVQETAGGITLGSDARFLTNFGTDPGECSPPEGAPDLTASYHVAQPFPTFGSTTPGGVPYEIAMGISSSGFNQLLRSMIECGLLVASITELDIFGNGAPIPLTAGLLSAFVPALSSWPATLPARIDIKPTIGPLITGAPGPGGELALLKIAQVHMEVIIELGDGQGGIIDFPTAEMMLDADVGIDLTVDAGTGSLVFALAEPDPLDISVKSVENPLAVDLSSVEALLPSVVGSFLPDLAGGLGGFPIPSFLGLTLDVVEVSRNGEMLTIYANLQAGAP